MKLLIISTVRFRLNGITSVILNYYRNMKKEDMQIDFVVINEISDTYRKELEGNGSRIFQIDRKKNSFTYYLALKKVLAENSYDIVHIHGNSAMILPEMMAAKRAGVPVRIAHSHNTSCSHVRLHKMLYPLFRRSYTHGFACGQAAGKWMFRDNPFVEIKNGIDLKEYRYEAAVRKLYRKRINAENKIVIGHIGNFIEVKNHTFLIDTFAELVKRKENLLLLLISDGPLMEGMKEKTHRLGLDNKVIFLGKTTEVSKYLQAMDLFVLPSLHEGLPVVLIEAQAAGLPCIAADTVSREADLTQHMTFLPIQNPVVWADALEQKIDQLSKQDRTDVSEQWQERIKHAGYDVTVNADRMKELYQQYMEAVRI